ncbi:MAG: hypothetical protein HYU98_07045, partial [Deltaproteobacteria bacterium]|nr:hypothetical protein [Deltaproteobacteria bacterium]
VWFGTFDEFKDSGDWSKFDSDAMNSMFASYEGNFDSFYEGGVLSGTATSTVYGFMYNTDYDSFGDDEGAMKDYFAQMGSTFETQSWDDLYGKEEVYAANWQGQYETAGGSEGSGAFTFTEIADDDATGATSCLDMCKATGGTNESCFDDCFGGGGDSNQTLLAGNYGGTRSGCPDAFGNSILISGFGPYALGPLSISWTSGSSSCTSADCSTCMVTGSGAAGTVIHGVCNVGGGMFPTCDFTYTKQ